MMTDFDKLKGWAKDAWDKQAKWREQAEDDFAFVDGHQWDADTELQMKADNRVPVTFNRTAVIIGSVAGFEINNRTEVRYIPREIGDVKANEVLTAGGEWFRDVADAEDADSEAFRQLLICGVGATDTGLDWDADPDGEPMVKCLRATGLFWDPHSWEKGMKDKRYNGYVHQLPLSEAKDRFEGQDIADVHADWLKVTTKGSVEETTAGDNYKLGEDNEEEPETITVVEIQYRERTRTVEYTDMSGKKQSMPKADWDKLLKRMPINLPSRVKTEWQWKRAYLGKSAVLDESQPDPKGSTINMMTGHWDAKDKMFYGLLRPMRDPQKYANKWLSQTLHIINTNAKGGVMAEAGAVDDVEQFEESWAGSDSVTWLRDGALSSGRVMEKPKAQMPQALMALTEFAISAIRDSCGVNLELLGMRDANQPGVLEYQRRQSAMTTLARYFDALRYYRKRQGHTILAMLVRWIAPTGRLVRIVKDDLAQYVPLAVKDDTQTYDVIVDDAPSSPNEKEKAWSIIQAMLPLLEQAGLALEDWADILEYSPLPSSFVDKVRKKALEQRQQPPDPVQQQGQMLALKEVQSTVEKNLAQAEQAHAKAQQIETETHLQPLKTLSDMRGQRMNEHQGLVSLMQKPQPGASPA
jgi:hypothetical protein